ncbi:uncharacterized protein (DUF58 family) [Cytobacillus eiseniae]|uniref:Uncharacterized protein (DUF58 family) n=1 Tax=Cytobacillus eiseniae TaxID=762947 RepID=A0ABS4RAL6_9BACI|nr:DUF58 domain-containing protein [Cytobacillus eiseniae]MBP2239932.1 uncharacterized protein (DUF58 family) [Cytobacillus eiseniae]
MEWKKYSIEDQYLSLTAALALFLFFASMYFQSLVIFFAAVFLLVFILANSLYLKYIGERLYFENKWQREKFFPNEKGEWILPFVNKGLPIMKGELRVYFDDIVTPLDEFGVKRTSQYEFSIPLSLNYNESNIVKIPYTTRKRGLAKIRRIEWHIPHFFGIGETVLEYKGLVMQEALIYPMPAPVKNVRSFLSERLGESLVSHSLYEDYLSPSGTRDYVYSDSFNRINWKASAVMQKLQTKLYDRVQETGWNLSLNIADRHAITNHLELLLSCAAELAYYSTKHNIPFSFCMNIRIAGSIPFYFIPAGTGKEQLQKVLEALAIVDQHSSVLPYEKMLAFYHRHLPVQPYFIHGGKSTVKTEDVFQAISKKGATLIELQLHENEAVLVHKQSVKKEVVGT